MSLPSELEKLSTLHQQGAISKEEFEKAKEQLLTQKGTIEPFTFGDAFHLLFDPIVWMMCIIGTIFTLTMVVYYFTGEDGGLRDGLSTHLRGQAILLLIGAGYLIFIALMTSLDFGRERGLLSGISALFLGILGGWGGYLYAKSITDESLLLRISDWYESLIAGQNITINRIAWYTGLGSLLAVWLCIFGMCLLNNLRRR